MVVCSIDVQQMEDVVDVAPEDAQSRIADGLAYSSERCQCILTSTTFNDEQSPEDLAVRITGYTRTRRELFEDRFQDVLKE